MQFKLKFFFAILLFVACNKAWAQVCTGSLGDPVFTFDFGSGNDMRFPVTGYQFVGGSCPNDGQYSISKTETGCHDDTWHRVLKDHTGNDGYMMVVNADAVAGKEFFSKQTTLDGTNTGVLCENTTYEFSAYILNLIKAGQFGFIEPKITFTIETLDGTQIGSPYTVDIPPTYNPDDWQKYATYFTTPAGVTAVVVKMVNNAPGGAGNDFLLDDITFRACGPVVQASFADDIAATQTNLCVGSAKVYNITSPVTGDANQKYQWQQNLNDGAGWTDLPGEESTLLTRNFDAGKPVGTYQYRLGVASGGSISSLNCRVYSNAVTINIAPYPTPASLQPVSVCEGEPLTLIANGGAVYKWTGPGIANDNHNPLIIPVASAANAGHYTVEVISAANCSTFREVDVAVNLKPVINVAAVPPVCRGSSTQLTATVADAETYTYSWLPVTGLSDPHAANPMASPTISTLYTVTVINAITGCYDTRQVQVNVLDLPVADAGADKKIFEGQSVKLGANVNTANVLSYSWSPADYLDDPHSATPVANPPFDVNYQLTVTSDNGCGIVTDDVFVRVYQKIVIPTTFTPNNDGVNDIWNIEALETYPESTISIYNRNGKQVYQNKGYGKPWDGKLNGSLLPSGTYYYVIDLKNGTPNLSGWVLLVR